LIVNSLMWVWWRNVLSCLSRLLIKFKASERVVHQVGKSSSSHRCRLRERETRLGGSSKNKYIRTQNPPTPFARINNTTDRASERTPASRNDISESPHLYRECSRICGGVRALKFIQIAPSIYCGERATNYH
jgi:hypothetical protein